MSLDALYSDGIEEGLTRWAANPGPVPEPGFSATSFGAAGLKGIPSAALEIGGSVSDVLSAYGTAAATAPISAGGMFSLPTQEEQKQQEDARQRMLKGDAFNVGPGNVARAKAQEFAPDPITAHKADQVIHGVFRFGAKAVGAVGTMGPIGGGLMLGLEEGNTVTQNLRTEGVDTKTAAKVGAVQGTLAAGGAVLPIAGKTITQTLGLVGVGGPGSYMAQEYLSREILAQAGYNDQASLHNPFDPLGLTLSAVIPGGFGALHMRGTFKRAEAVKTGVMPLEQMKPEELRGLKYNDVRLDKYASATAEKYGVPPAILLAIKNAGEKSNPTAVSKAGAQGVMQFMPGTAKEMGLVDRTDPIASIDAGARYMRKLYDAYGSWDAAIAHYNGGGTQAAIVRGGGRPTYNETAGYLDRVQKYVAEHTAQQVAKSPEVVDAARVAVLNETVAKSLPDTPDAMAQMQRAADIVAESGGRRAEMEIAPVRDIDLPQFREWFGGSQVVEWGTSTPRVVYHGTASDVPEFSIGRAGSRDSGDFGEAIYLADSAETAARYASKTGENPDLGSAGRADGANVMPLYVKAERPLVLYTEEDFKALWNKAGGDEAFFTKTPKEQAEFIQSLGYDSVYDKKYGQWAVFKPEQVKSAIGNSGKFDPNSASLTDPLQPGERSPREASNALPDPGSVKLAGDEPAPRGAEVGAVRNEAGQALPTDAEAAKPSEAGSIDALMAQKLAAEQPDLQVILPGTDTPISVKEAMARIAEEQKQDTQWADLVRVAAECALMA
jgi:hypothetical protein